MPRNPNMTFSQIQWQRSIWLAVRQAALRDGIPAAEWVRRAVARALKEEGDRAR